MSYQVLARKWRPQNFQEMVGQEHVLKALGNALDQDRLHHAYLFTGTRGVGKTTVARIFAKSLNCETGITSHPCGQCAVCREITEGRFVDLIEIDAASRTKVEDMRELLDNVQYAPTRGRYKIYLIDEVHMLSNSSFNALLKTLEEPPPHIKFLLATTDPQKLPVTILSRCLQFNLKNLSPERIVRHLTNVLSAEQVTVEEAALWELAKAAEGSMRDALSLTDQAIAFGNGAIKAPDVIDMLGTIEKHVVLELLQLVSAMDAPAVLAKVQHMAEFSPDYVYILQALAELLHRVAIEQAVPGAIDNSFGDQQQVVELARTMAAEDTQLFYQIALLSRKDLALAPDSRVGFEMALLRMLSFRPNARSAREIQRSDGSAGKASSSSEAADPESDSTPQPAPDLPSLANSESAVSEISEVIKTTAPVVVPVAGGQENVSRQKEHSTGEAENPRTNVAHDRLESGVIEKYGFQPESPSSSPPPEPQARPETVTAPGAEASPESGIDDYSGYADGDFDSQGDDLIPVREDSFYDHGELDAAAAIAVPVTPPVQEVKTEQSEKAAPPRQPPENSIPLADIQSPDSDEEDFAEDQEEELEQYELSARNMDREFEIKREISGQPGEEPLLKGQTWDQVLRQLEISGMTRNLAQRCVMQDVLGQRVEFWIDQDHFDFFNEMHKTRMQTALSDFMGETVTIEVVIGRSTFMSPMQKVEKQRAERQADAEREIRADEHVQAMIDRFGAILIEPSIEPVIREL